MVIARWIEGLQPQLPLRPVELGGAGGTDQSRGVGIGLAGGHPAHDADAHGTADDGLKRAVRVRGSAQGCEDAGRRLVKFGAARAAGVGPLVRAQPVSELSLLQAAVAAPGTGGGLALRGRSDGAEDASDAAQRAAE